MVCGMELWTLDAQNEDDDGSDAAELSENDTDNDD